MCLSNLKLLCLCGLLWFVGGAQWLTANEICNTQCDVSRLQIGADFTHASVKIDNWPAFHGNLQGIQGIYEYKPWNSLYGGLKIAWKQGKAHDSCADRSLVYVDAEERIGYTYSACCNWSITLFSGLGFRYMEHTLKHFKGAWVDSFKPLAEFKYNTFYIPVGFLSEYCFRPGWSIGYNITWMPQVYPTVEIIPLKGAHWSLQKKFDNFLIELPLTYAFAQDNCRALILKPFYECWEDGRSTAKTSGGARLGLPKHSYHFWGVVISFLSTF